MRSTTRSRRRTIAGGAAAVSAALATLAAAPVALGAGDAVVVDQGGVLALAGDGSSAAWLHADYAPGNPGTPTSVTLRVRAADGTVTQVPQKLPTHTRGLALGKDAKGVPTVVLAAGGSTGGQDTTTLYALPADGSAAPRKLAVSKAAGPETAPGLLNGVLSFTRTERVRKGGPKVATVRLGTLTSSRSRLLSRGEKRVSVDETVPTAHGGVAYVTEHPDGELVRFELRVLRPGHASKRISSTFHGQASGAAFGALVPDATGSRFSVTRWNEEGGDSDVDRTVYRAPSGTRVSRTDLQPGEVDLGVAVKGGVLYVNEQGGADRQTPQLEFHPAG